MTHNPQMHTIKQEAVPQPRCDPTSPAASIPAVEFKQCGPCSVPQMSQDEAERIWRNTNIRVVLPL